LVFNSAGDLWVANYNNGTVVEFTREQLVKTGAAAGAYARRPPDRDGLADLFVHGAITGEFR
jgi:hypothetical protein